MSKLTKDDAERVLFLEARLLDEGRLEEWLELFTDDGTYTLPLDGYRADPDITPTLIYDDGQRRRERVHRILATPAYAQRPRSETVHAITNVEVEDHEANGDVLVRCVVVVYELRPGQPEHAGLGEQRSFAGRCHYVLRWCEGAWLIASKTVTLLNRRSALANFSFVL